MIVVTFFSTLMDIARMEGGPSKELVEAQMELGKSVLELLEKERRGKRQNVRWVPTDETKSTRKTVRG